MIFGVTDGFRGLVEAPLVKGSPYDRPTFLRFKTALALTRLLSWAKAVFRRRLDGRPAMIGPLVIGLDCLVLVCGHLFIAYCGDSRRRLLFLRSVEDRTCAILDRL